VHITGSVAIFALDFKMDIFLMKFIDFSIALFTNLSSLMNRFQAHDLSKSVGPIMSEFSEGLWSE